jgi:hypothetical protein
MTEALIGDGSRKPILGGGGESSPTLIARSELADSSKSTSEPFILESAVEIEDEKSKA